MANNKTAVDWLEEKIFQEFKVPISNEVYEQAKKMEKEQIIEFAYKVLQNAECSFNGIPYLEKDIDDIYNETYNVKDN
jgi:hypothetical protein